MIDPFDISSQVRAFPGPNLISEGIHPQACNELGGVLRSSATPHASTSFNRDAILVAEPVTQPTTDLEGFLGSRFLSEVVECAVSYS